MNYRIAEILASQDLGVSGTKVIDVDVSDPISRIVLKYQPTNGSEGGIAHVVKDITKLELVDGADVLFGLSGYLAQALNIFEAKYPSIQELDSRNGGTPLIYVNIDFGRRLWDPELAFDPKRFRNPQIKLTWNEAAHDASCTSHSFLIYALCFDEKAISPSGFLSAKTIKTYNPVSGAYEYTDLPNDYPFRKLILQGMKDRAGIRGLIETIKLSEGQDKKVLFEGDEHDLRAVFGEMGGDAFDIVLVNAALTGTKCWVTPHNVGVAVAAGDTAARVILANPVSGGSVQFQSETGTTGVQASVSGKNPHGCMSIPFGNQDDIADWYDVTTKGTIKIRIKGGTSSASGDEVSIALQQLRRY